MTVPDLQAALTAHRAGRLAEADTLYSRLLALDPKNAEALRLRGVLACQENRFESAVALLREAIRLDGHKPAYHANLAVALKGLGRTEEALAAVEQAAASEPDNLDIRYNAACLLQELGRRDDAATAYEGVLAAAPDHVEALCNLGLLRVEMQRAAEALPLLQRALVLKPDFQPARINLGLALLELDEVGKALACFANALQADPDNAVIHYNLANALHAARRYEDAIEHGSRAIDLRPEYPEAFHNRGSGWRELGNPRRAVADYRRALELQPDHSAAWRNLLSTLLYIPDIPPAERFTDHRRFARSVTKNVRAPLRLGGEPGQALRIGYLSSDFRRHPVARNLEPIIAEHRRQGFFVALYAEVRRPDDVSARFRSEADLWRSTAGLSDEAVADQIRADRIDILVHLAGRFDRNRPSVAALRAAPLQVSFHDPATSGFDAMDYLIGDRFLVPRTSTERFVERILRLPSFYIHAPLSEAPDPGPLPCGEAGPVTFVSFNHPVKLDAAVLDLWAQLLVRVPGSRLMLKHRHRFGRPVVQRRVLDALQKAGVATDRVIFMTDETERHNHLELYRQADIALDPFPFTGSTTTFEALWMGVPVVTLAGPEMVSRWSGSMLRTMGLGDLVASSKDDYVRIAATLASDRQRLVRLRKELRPRLAASPLCDGARRGRQIGRLYRAVWRRWCLREQQGA